MRSIGGYSGDQIVDKQLSLLGYPEDPFEGTLGSDKGFSWVTWGVLP